MLFKKTSRTLLCAALMASFSAQSHISSIFEPIKAGMSELNFVAGFKYGPSELDFSSMPIALPEGIARNPSLAPQFQTQNIRSHGKRVYLGLEGLVQGSFFGGVEFGYFDWGKAMLGVFYEGGGPDDFDYGVRDITSRGIDVLLTGRYVFCSGVNLFVKAGVADVTTKVDQYNIADFRNPSVSDLAHNVKRTYRNLVPEVEVGLGAQIADFVNLYVSYTHIKGYNTDYPYTDIGILPLPSKVADLNMVAIGIDIEFGCRTYNRLFG